ncbi:hypothetical protein ACFVIM_17285 [Streptomyces sp. NPDC057638]|uniref:hypothetical protein n=1 Tax=Streptomyces sp. NPDC057638 TaxID=3346190 RepID=UPI00367D6678
MSSPDPREARLDEILAAAHDHLGTVIHDRLTSQGGPPELRDPDQALDRLLAQSHRAVGDAVTARLADQHHSSTGHTALHQPPWLGTPGPLHPLRTRPATVRLKYRQDALRIAETYWPLDLAATLQRALALLAELDTLPGTPAQVRRASTLAGELVLTLRQVLRLPEPRRRPASPLGADYLDEVEIHLASGAEGLYWTVDGARQHMEEELRPRILAAARTAEGDPLEEARFLGQDLTDDLTAAYEQATALYRAIAEIRAISSDFVGADLSHAQLEGVALEGVRWDAATLWPTGWEAPIRRASHPVGGEQGVLVIAAEPRRTAVAADA